MGFEPTTVCLGSKNSTPELHPQGEIIYTIKANCQPCLVEYAIVMNYKRL